MINCRSHLPTILANALEKPLPNLRKAAGAQIAQSYQREVVTRNDKKGASICHLNKACLPHCGWVVGGVQVGVGVCGWGVYVAAVGAGVDFELYQWMIGGAEHKCQVGGLAIPAHALNDNVGVFRCAGGVQKSCVDQQGKRLLDFDTFITKPNCASIS